MRQEAKQMREKTRNHKKLGYTLPASYTVEAAFIMPIMLIGIMKGILLGMDLCEEQHIQARHIAQQKQTCAVEILRKYELYEDIWNYMIGEEEDAD